MKYLKTNLKHAKRIITICSLAFISLTSCSGDDGPGKAACASGLWIQSVQAELTAWTDAIQAYNSDPTDENCQKYKSTGQKYINALDSVKACVPNQSLADFEDSLEEAKTEISNISC